MSEQEADAWKVWDRMGGGISYRKNKPHPSEYVEYEPLYTFAHRRKPLSDDQIIAAIKNISYNEMSAFNIARAVEKAHGIGVKE